MNWEDVVLILNISLFLKFTLEEFKHEEKTNKQEDLSVHIIGNFFIASYKYDWM